MSHACDLPLLAHSACHPSRENAKKGKNYCSLCRTNHLLFELFIDRVLGEFFAPAVSRGKPHSKSSHNKIIKNTLDFLLQHVASSETSSFVRRTILSSLRSITTQV